MRNRDYSNGYIPKIQYWNSELQKALSANDFRHAETCMAKMDHFIASHVLTYPDRPESIEYKEKDSKIWDAFIEKLEKNS
jgi:hypothetical protein